MIIYFSTVVRKAPSERGGELVKLDWDSKRVLARVRIAATDPPVHDPNPRGSSRGGRGILLNGSELYAASYHTIHVFDRDLKPRGALANFLFAGLHELCWEDDEIWASATDLDLAIKVDRKGNVKDQWWPREDAEVAARFRLSPLDIDKLSDNRGTFVGVSARVPGHVHLNAMAILDGRPLMLLNRYGCIVRLRPTEILMEDRTLAGCHNLLVTPDRRILVNDTVNRTVRVYDHAGGLLNVIDLCQYAPVRSILRRHRMRDAGIWLSRYGRPQRLFYGLFGELASARPVFVRGLAATPHGTMLVGVSPATILEIDLSTRKLVDFYTDSKSVHDCIHGLVCDLK